MLQNIDLTPLAASNVPTDRSAHLIKHQWRVTEAEALDRRLARVGGTVIILVQVDGVAVVDCRFDTLPASTAATRIERRLRERYRSDIRFRLDLYRRLRADGRVFVPVAVRAPVEPAEPEGADWQPLGEVAATIVKNLARIPRASQRKEREGDPSCSARTPRRPHVRCHHP